jgi:two-component system OmpR family sensor kinase
MSDSPRRGLRLPRWSVRSRILASILVVAAVGLGGAGVTTYLVQRARILSSVDAQLESRALHARSIATDADADSVTAALTDILQRLVPDAHEGSVGILNGKPTFGPPFPSDLRLDDSPAFTAEVVREVGATSVWLGSTEIDGRLIRYIAVPVGAPGSTDTGIYVDAVDLPAELGDLNTAFATYTIVALIALAAIALVGWFVAGRLLSPIRRLRAATSRITASDLKERIPVAGRDDVSELTETVNDMFDRLDTAMTSQRQLLDDVRHELKTPITIIRGHLELLDPGNVKDVDATRALAIDELDRMADLVDDIEALAETQRAIVNLRPTDIDVLTEGVFAKVSVLAGHEWQLRETARASVEVDADRITQAWLQLADNAAKYSPDGTTIALGSREVDGDVELWVEDRGPGIPRESWSRIFERFGRVDTGRGIRGSGLGLPIVAAIARAHGGRVALVSTADGSRFGIRIPLDQATVVPASPDEEIP